MREMVGLPDAHLGRNGNVLGVSSLMVSIATFSSQETSATHPSH